MTQQAVVLTGRQIDLYRFYVLAKALELWALHKIQVNRGYTPKRMMELASELCGKTFKPRDYLGAAKELKLQIERAKRNGRVSL